MLKKSRFSAKKLSLERFKRINLHRVDISAVDILKAIVKYEVNVTTSRRTTTLSLTCKLQDIQIFLHLFYWLTTLLTTL